MCESALLAQLAIRARRPLPHWHARHTREQGLWQWQSERQAGQWPGAPSGIHLRSPDSARARLQVPMSHQPFCKRRTSLIHQKSRFFIVAIGRRCLCHRMLVLVALITMVCSDMADCNASSRDCKSKSGAPWRAATGCLGVYPDFFHFLFCILFFSGDRKRKILRNISWDTNKI